MPPAQILHIGADWPFLVEVARQFEYTAPRRNRFLILTQPGQKSIHFPSDEYPVAFRPLSYRSVGHIAEAVSKADAVIAHGMIPLVAMALSALPGKVPLLWSGWGFDYYESLKGYTIECLGPRTRSFARSRASSVDTFAGAVTDGVRRRLRQAAMHRAARRSDYFSAPIPTDEQVFRRAYPNFSGDYLQLNYGSMDSMFGISGRDPCPPVETGAVLLGNSATPSNNHLDAFALLAPLVEAGMTVIAPLSYGDSNYAGDVAAAGQRAFGASFMPITDYLPLAAYNKLVARCHIVLMYHRRQQAVGNVGTALFQGAHVYLHDDSPVLDFLGRLGTSVRPASSLLRGPVPTARQAQEMVARDRDALESFWGEEQVLANASRVATTLLGSS